MGPGEVALGVDVGSTSWKGVALDASGRIVARRVEATNPRIEGQTERLVAELRADSGAGIDAPLGATGYGRSVVDLTAWASQTVRLRFVLKDADLFSFQFLRGG